MAPNSNDMYSEWNNMNREVYQQWEKGMTAWWDQVLDNPSFLGALGNNVSQMSKARAAYEKAVDETLNKAHLPTRADLVRVARIATLLEEKVLQVEDIVLEVQDNLGRIEKEALLARIETSEGRVDLNLRLDRIEAALTVRALDEAAAKKAPVAAKKAPVAAKKAPVAAKKAPATAKKSPARSRTSRAKKTKG